MSSRSDRAGEHVRKKTASVVREQLQCSGSSACLNKTDMKLTDCHFERDESRSGGWGGDGATRNTNTVMVPAFANIPAIHAIVLLSSHCKTYGETHVH